MSPTPAATITELFDSGRAASGDTETNELRYLVEFLDDESDVIALVATTAPASIGPMERQAVDVTPLGNMIWECVVTYEGKPDETQYTFETGGATAHITQSLQTIARHAAAGETAPNFQGAIGVNGDSIDGTDITVPVYNFTETRKVESSAVTGAYKLALFNCTGKTNNASFKGFATGEVLFLGASGSKTGREHWEIAFKFAASPNVTSLAVGGSITVASKKGWEYLWVRFRDAEDGAANALVKTPVAAYVERVYESADFSTLGIGT
jgi:hypothetical protein